MNINDLINIDNADLDESDIPFVEIDYKKVIYQCYLGDEKGVGFVDEGLQSYDEYHMCMACEEFLLHCQCANKKKVSANKIKEFEKKERTVFIVEIIEPWTQVSIPIDSAMAKAIVRRLATVRRAIFRKERKDNVYIGTPSRAIYYNNRECKGCNKLIREDDIEGGDDGHWTCPRCWEIN